MGRDCAIFVVGMPATGKTTLVRKFLEPFSSYLVASPKWTVCGDVCAAGHYGGGTFDGADTIAFDGAMRTLEFWGANSFFGCMWTFLDGDRMSNRKCLAYADRVSLPVCVLLDAPDDVVEGRMEGRGSNQNPSWVKGRKTKSKRFYDEFEGPKACIDSSGTASDTYLSFLDFIETIDVGCPKISVSASRSTPM